MPRKRLDKGKEIVETSDAKPKTRPKDFTQPLELKTTSFTQIQEIKKSFEVCQKKAQIIDNLVEQAYKTYSVPVDDIVNICDSKLDIVTKNADDKLTAMYSLLNENIEEHYQSVINVLKISDISYTSSVVKDMYNRCMEKSNESITDKATGSIAMSAHIMMQMRNKKLLLFTEGLLKFIDSLKSA